MRYFNRFENRTARVRPSQARGKERVRLIMAAALALFRERGLEQVTTNDIARQAGIPIGSLYRYYPNKDSIITALTELYVTDISHVFAQVGKHPMLEHLSWEEVLLLMVDGWVNYARLNGSFALLYAIKASPRLFAQNKTIWRQFVDNFAQVIRQRCPVMSDKDIALCLQFCLAASELSINNEAYAEFGPQSHYDAVGVIAAHMLKVCGWHNHDGGDILG